MLPSVYIAYKAPVRFPYNYLRAQVYTMYLHKPFGLVLCARKVYGLGCKGLFKNERPSCGKCLYTGLDKLALLALNLLFWVEGTVT